MLDLTFPDDYEPSWEIQDVNFSAFMNIDKREFQVWKAFPIKGLFIIFIFRRDFNSNLNDNKSNKEEDLPEYLYISRYYVVESIFEKPKKISKTHKLYDLTYCIQMKSNILVLDDKFILLNTKSNEVVRYSEKDFLSL